MDVLWLSEYDVEGALTMDEALQAVEMAFREHGMGRTQMPPKSYLRFEKHDGDLRTMPAYLEERGEAGVKIVNVHPGNASRALPSVMALIVLNSEVTGAPLAVMGGAFLTSMRTGAAGGLATKLLGRKGCNVIGMIGAGVQAKTQLLALSRIYKISEVKVYDLSPGRATAFAKDCGSFVDCDIRETAEPSAACDCDILVTTTPSRKPVVLSDWIKEGTHINAIGADAAGKQELESDILKRSLIVVDDPLQAVHSGEVNVPISKGEIKASDIHARLGDILVGKSCGRTNDSQITIFDSTGLAIQDVAVASIIYEKAMSLGSGRLLKLM